MDKLTAFLPNGLYMVAPNDSIGVQSLVESCLRLNKTFCITGFHYSRTNHAYVQISTMHSHHILNSMRQLCDLMKTSPENENAIHFMNFEQLSKELAKRLERG